MSMWLNILQTTIISIVIIAIIHHIIQHCKDTYTTKKTYDILGYQTQKYKDIIAQIQENVDRDKQKVASMSTGVDALFNEVDQDQMAQDLAQFVETISY